MTNWARLEWGQVALLAFSFTLPTAFSQTAGKAQPFVIDPDRYFVYLKFDHIGKGIKRSDEESEIRIWLKFVNNCNVPVNLRTFGTPEGSPAEEVGVMDFVVPELPPRGVIVTTDAPISPTTVVIGPDSSSPNQTESSDSRKYDSVRDAPPPDYWFELGSGVTVQPGKEVLFSIPLNQLGRTWHVEVPFNFKVPQGKCCRAPIVGGEPEMHITYSIYDLLGDVRARIVKQQLK